MKNLHTIIELKFDVELVKFYRSIYSTVHILDREKWNVLEAVSIKEFKNLMNFRIKFS